MIGPHGVKEVAQLGGGANVRTDDTELSKVSKMQ